MCTLCVLWVLRSQARSQLNLLSAAAPLAFFLKNYTALELKAPKAVEPGLERAKRNAKGFKKHKGPF